ncbi:MAG TPA: type II toxin-antitoxin system RelE/ParE family toxin [Rudaea sp.]|nr:type II toxin-antitoxin system RelE/ParE family toxin [Rudaea sp.]
MKPAILSKRAAADIEGAAAGYAGERAELADAFIDALEHAVRHLETHPAAGSPRYAHVLAIPQLRFWLLRKFPFALFYIEQPDRLYVIRCVHMKRDIPASLRDEET